MDRRGAYEVEKRYVSIACWRVASLAAGLLRYFRTRGIPALGSWEFISPLLGRAVPDVLVLLPGTQRPTCVYLGQPLATVAHNEWLYTLTKVNADVADFRSAFAMSQHDAEAVLTNTDLDAGGAPTAREHAFLERFHHHLATAAAFGY